MLHGALRALQTIFFHIRKILKQKTDSSSRIESFLGKAILNIAVNDLVQLGSTCEGLKFLFRRRNKLLRFAMPIFTVLLHWTIAENKGT
jgi:hypothetical protein